MTNIEVISSEDVLEALRLWHGGDSPNWPLAKLRINLQMPLQKEIHGSLAEAGPAAQNRAVLSLGLDELKKASPEAEDLLRARFEHRRDVISVANSLNVSEPSVYYRQRQSIHQLTEILLQLESTASADWRNRMTARLELQTYSQLVGVQQSRAALLEALLDNQAHFIVALDGLGGIGKTALADQVTRDLIQTTRFDEIAWITAKHTHLSTLGRLQIESGRPALTFPMLVDKLAHQFDLSQHDDLTQLDQQRLVIRFLRERTCLIVIDNLETVADYHNLLPELRKWQRPTKFLLTSRLRLLDEPDVFSLPLKELSIDSAYKLIRFEAERTGFTDLAKASEADLQAIYQAVGGNPLALKLIIGQLRFHSLSHVLKRFGQASNQPSDAGIFDYIYREIWETLDDAHKMVLLALTQAGETGFNLDHIAEISTISLESVSRSLEKLILLSMVDLSGNLLERRYRLHRLTEVFLLKMFAEE
ncbi:MAG: hypothetical protein H6667_03145 [Ardenticatenaceae bacterium]|nr:hypothetical protein [Ardenticatenaceae bacterium]MCB9443006.1 hypothetical protein [Ardenticatenaceae bacterium]